MPKTTVHGGASYAGHVDVSSEDTAAPEWATVDVVPAEVAEAAPVEPNAEPEQADDEPEKPARRRTRTSAKG